MAGRESRSKLLTSSVNSASKRDRTAVASFEFDLESNLLALSNELRDRTYQPGNYTSFYIYEPKRRLVSAAPFRDRVVHHALCSVIEPIYERKPPRSLTNFYPDKLL